MFAVWSLVGNQALFAGREALARRSGATRASTLAGRRRCFPGRTSRTSCSATRLPGLGDREGALRAYRDAVEADPRNWVAWLRLAQVARGAERGAAYDRVRRLNPLEEGLPGE